MYEYNQLAREHKIAEVKMLFENGLSCAEIADLLDIPETSIRSITNE